LSFWASPSTASTAIEFDIVTERVPLGQVKAAA
jgi:hypothetical protein